MNQMQSLENGTHHPWASVDYLFFFNASALGLPENIRLIVCRGSRIEHYGTSKNQPLFETRISDEWTCIGGDMETGRIAFGSASGIAITGPFGDILHRIELENGVRCTAVFESGGEDLYLLNNAKKNGSAAWFRQVMGPDGIEYQFEEEFTSHREVYYLSAKKNLALIQYGSKIEPRKLFKDRDRYHHGNRYIGIRADMEFHLFDTETDQFVYQWKHNIFEIALPVFETESGCLPYTFTRKFETNGVPAPLSLHFLNTDDFPQSATRMQRVLAGQPTLITCLGGSLAYSDNVSGSIVLFNVCESYLPAWIVRKQDRALDSVVSKRCGLYAAVDFHEIREIFPAQRTLISFGKKSVTSFDINVDGDIIIACLSYRENNTVTKRSVAIYEKYRGEWRLYHETEVDFYVHHFSLGKRVAVFMVTKDHKDYQFMAYRLPEQDLFPISVSLERNPDYRHVVCRVLGDDRFYPWSGNRRMTFEIDPVTGECKQMDEMRYSIYSRHYTISHDGAYEAVYDGHDWTKVAVLKNNSLQRHFPYWVSDHVKSFFQAEKGAINSLAFTFSNRYLLCLFANSPSPHVLVVRITEKKGDPEIFEIPVDCPPMSKYYSVYPVFLESDQRKTDEFFTVSSDVALRSYLPIYSVARRKEVMRYRALKKQYTLTKLEEDL